MEIRTLSIDQYDSIIQLWEDAGLPGKPNGRDSYEEMKREFHGNSDLKLGAFEDDELIGVIIGTDDNRKGWINRLAVKPEYKRQGVASRLMEELESALKKRGRRIICTLVEETNDPSLSFFAKKHYHKHEDIFYLTKRESDDI